jgi:hypothetical protein
MIRMFCWVVALWVMTSLSVPEGTELGNGRTVAGMRTEGTELGNGYATVTPNRGKVPTAPCHRT